MRNSRTLCFGLLISLLLAGCGNPDAVLESVLKDYDKGAFAEDTRERALIAVQAGANPNIRYRDNTPLLLAIEWQDADLVDALLQAGANTVPARRTDGYFDEPALRKAAYIDEVTPNSLRIIRSLLAAGVDINGHPEHQPPVAAAAEKGATAIVQLLLDAGAHPDPDPDNYYSALGEAVGGKHMDTIELLLSRNPSVATLSNALWPAACSGFIDIYEKLLEAGAKTESTQDLLVCAIGTMKPEMVGYLSPTITSTADSAKLYAATAANLNRPEEYRQVAKQIFTILVSNGIKPPPGSLDDALQLAQEMNDADAIRFLSQHLK